MKYLIIASSIACMAFSVSAAELNGKALFMENCAVCHGNTGKGGKLQVKGPRLVGDATHWKLPIFQRAVLEGVDDNGRTLDAAMPHWKDSSFKADAGVAPRKEEVAAIYRYLRTVK